MARSIRDMNDGGAVLSGGVSGSLSVTSIAASSMTNLIGTSAGMHDKVVKKHELVRGNNQS